MEGLTFEDALRELESTVQRLEAGNLSLDESLTLFEAGKQLSAKCQQFLNAAVLRVEQLTADGEIVEVDVD